MGGTIEGGIAAKNTNYSRYGKDFYRTIGAKGGKINYGKPKGFAAMPREKRIAAGIKGGTISRRRPRDA